MKEDLPDKYEVIDSLEESLEALQKDYKDLSEYISDAGWEDWMDDYCEDPENPSIEEINEIEDVQEEAFLEWKSKQEWNKAWKDLDGIKDWWNKNVKEKYITNLSEDDFKLEMMEEFQNTGSVEIGRLYSKTGNPLLWIY